MKEITIVLRIDRRVAVGGLAALIVLAGTLRLSSETLQLTASYPAPVGVYNQIVTTGNAGSSPADTTLSRSAGNVVLVPATNAGGRVGVGTATPGAKLDVVGSVRIQDGTQAAGKVLSSDASGNASWQHCTYAP